MSTVARTKRPAKISNKTASEARAPRMTRDTEAPDRGADPTDREAPDSGRLRIAEAPDAGEGRQALVEHEFTHGRSQS